MKKITGIVGILVLLISCNTTKDTEKATKEIWKINGFIDSIQILLTNNYQLNESFGFGASSFLIRSETDTLICTAKHLLGEAMGINPEIPTDSFNFHLKFWKAFPRHNKLSNDTIDGIKLINEEINDVDIILQSCEIQKGTNIQPLKPRFSRIKPREKLQIIGCEYSDSDCHQRNFDAIMEAYEAGSILIRSKTKFSPNGFSGAPVIDSNGYVIGVLSGGTEFEGQLYLVIEPITKIINYLK